MATNSLPKNILLAGNPNCGKTTLFNMLTGMRHHTANYPGVTVETKSANIKILNSDKQFVFIPCTDLPGIYSLDAKSLDEEVAVKTFQNQIESKDSALLFYIVDSTNFPKSLNLFYELHKLGFKMVLVLNMYDLAQNKDYSINILKLSELLGVPVIKIEKRSQATVNEFKQHIKNFQKLPSKSETKNVLPPIEEVVAKSFYQPAINWAGFIQKADKYLLHPVFGPLIFFSIMAMVFQSIFSWSTIPMQAIENLMSNVAKFLGHTFPDGKINDLIVQGIMPGITGVLVFIPQIAFLFFFIAIMEESGYLARVSFMFDRLMQKFGLNGRSVISLIGGAACAVPSILSARTISNKKERLITIFVTPFISCSARLPVYAVLIALVVPKREWLIFNTQGLVLLGLYLLGIIAAFLSAWILNKFIKSDQKSFLILELPFYKRPTFEQVARVVWNKVQGFVLSAGKVILAISIVLWFLASHGPADRFKGIEQEFAGVELTDEQKSLKSSQKLENSYAGIVGKTIEPLIKPLGFDWKIGIALFTSFAAREVFVGTMSTIYSVGSENEQLLSEKLSEQKRPDGTPVFTLGVSVALMLFYAFAMQCMSTLAVVKKETESWLVALAQFAYMGVFAWVSAWMAYVLL